MPTSLKAAAVFAYVGAACFTLGGLSFLSGLAAERSVVTWESQLNLNNYTQIKALWAGRRLGRAGFLSADMFELLGWLFILPPINAAAVVLGGSQRSATFAFTACFIVAAVSNIVDFIFMAGATSVSDGFSMYFEKLPSGVPEGQDQDNLLLVPWASPLQMLELTYRMARSRTLWISALDNLLLTIAFSTVAFLAGDVRHRALSRWWVRFTVLCVVFAFIGTVVGAARAIEFGEVNMSFLRPINGIYFLSVVSVLLPLWLIWLGIQLQASHGKDFSPYVVRLEDDANSPRQRGVEMTSAAAAQQQEPDAAAQAFDANV